MCSTALSVSVTRSDAVCNQCQTFRYNEFLQLNLKQENHRINKGQQHTILLSINVGGVRRCDHIARLDGELEKEIMDFLQIRLAHYGFDSAVCFSSSSYLDFAWD